jgi:hypothetical protein
MEAMSNHLEDIAKRESKNSMVLAIGLIVALIAALFFYFVII